MPLPWFRLYPRLIDHRRWLSLTRVQRSCYIEILCAAAMEEPPGVVPLMGLGARLRWQPKEFSEALSAIIEVGLLEPIHAEVGSCSCRGRVVFAPCLVRVHAWDALQFTSDHAKVRQAKLRKSRESVPKSDATSPSLSRPRDGTDSDTDSDAETDPIHASHGATAETTAGAHREVFDLEADTERKHPLTAPRIKKPRRGWTEEAKRVRQDWCRRRGKQPDEDRVTMLAIQRRLADGVSVEELLAANAADAKRARPFSQAQMLNWSGFDVLAQEGQALLADEAVARRLASPMPGPSAVDVRSEIAATFGVMPEEVKVA